MRTPLFTEASGGSDYADAKRSQRHHRAPTPRQASSLIARRRKTNPFGDTGSGGLFTTPDPERTRMTNEPTKTALAPSRTRFRSFVPPTNEANAGKEAAV